MESGTYWTRNQPGFRFSSAKYGSAEFFADIEAHRYRLEPHIRDVVRFDRWRGRDVLEVGCGIGTDGAAFARAGARYTGLDAAATALDLARRRFTLEGLQGRFVHGSAGRLPFRDGVFDLVYSHGVIHHITGPEAAVCEFYRVLRPGGTALVMLYHRASFNYHFTIMVVRRVLAALLLVPGAAALVARITGEDKKILEAHRELLRAHGFRYLRDRALFLSNNTDGPGNPLSKVYSVQEVREIFRSFAKIDTTVRYLNLRFFPGGNRLSTTRIGRLLERRIGWHLYVEAVK